jgi:hypothetical protein
MQVCTSLAVARKPEVCTWAPATRDINDGPELALSSNVSRHSGGALTAEGRAAGSTLDLTHFERAQRNEGRAAVAQRSSAPSCNCRSCVEAVPTLGRELQRQPRTERSGSEP